jgi:alkylated DNA repair protein alkB family protein 4
MHPTTPNEDRRRPAMPLEEQAFAVKTCACSGIRWCRRCLDPELRRRSGMDPPTRMPAFLEAPDAALDGPAAPDFVHAFDARSGRAPGCPAFSGVRVQPDFVSETEALALLEEIEDSPLLQAQSGKWKQHFGPRINFNRRKLSADRFEGLPRYAHAIEAAARRSLEEGPHPSVADRRALERALAEYTTTDAFVLRYRQSERSNLDFHVDDEHAYGELILGLSLESDSVLTFLEGGAETGAGRPDGDLSAERVREETPEARPPRCVRVALPARSLLALYGPARSRWRHAILARDVRGQRTSITLRTLAPALRQTEAGGRVMRLARP